jgi:hypothetical protein
VPLRVIVDGAPLADAEARGVWQRFSAWMEEHPSDLGGFARAEGFLSVHPELHGGEPVLVVSRVAPQRPYTTAPTKRGAATTRPLTKQGRSRSSRPRRRG